MPRSVDRAGAVAAALRVAAGPGTRWIGIDGCSGSGKSSLAAEIAAEIAAECARVVVVAIDEFTGPGIAEWDWERLAEEVVRPLSSGQPARYRRWDWRRAADAGSAAIDAGSVVIVEGVSATRREAAVPWDLTVWVDAPREVRLARIRRREGAAAVGRWRDWLASEDAYVEREHPQQRADLVVSTG